MSRNWGITLPNVQYPEMPREDFYAFDELNFCVADGITRDPLINPDWTGVEMKAALKHYPNPSPAAIAAETVAKAFVIAVQNLPAVGALQAANTKVAELNKNLSCDYLRNDFAACIAAGGKIEGNELHWASVCDCQIAVFSVAGQQKFLSPNGMEKFLTTTHKNPGNWRDPARRVEVRRDFRNNPANPAAFGALTGEQSAEHFIISGHEKLESGDVIIAFSDGFAATIKHPNFWPNFQKSRDAFLEWELTLAEKDPEKYGHERTMVVVTKQL